MKKALIFLFLFSCKNWGCTNKNGCYPIQTDPHFFAEAIQEKYPHFEKEYLLNFYERNKSYLNHKNKWMYQKILFFEKNYKN